MKKYGVVLYGALPFAYGLFIQYMQQNVWQGAILMVFGVLFTLGWFVLGERFGAKRRGLWKSFLAHLLPLLVLVGELTVGRLGLNLISFESNTMFAGPLLFILQMTTSAKDAILYSLLFMAGIFSLGYLLERPSAKGNLWKRN